MSSSIGHSACLFLGDTLLAVGAGVKKGGIWGIKTGLVVGALFDICQSDYTLCQSRNASRQSVPCNNYIYWDQTYLDDLEFQEVFVWPHVIMACSALALGTLGAAAGGTYGGLSTMSRKFSRWYYPQNLS